MIISFYEDSFQKKVFQKNSFDFTILRVFYHIQEVLQ
jgi:hypothetical protein